MALAPQNEDAFVREVDEEVRRDQLTGIWRRYGRWMIGAVVVGLIALGGALYWQHHQREQAGADGEKFTQALMDLGENKEAGARPVLDALSKSDNPGYKATSRLTLGALALGKGDPKLAAAHYKAVAEDESAARPFRDLALVRQTAIEFDTMAPQAVVDRLKGLAIAGGPWFGSAGELVGLAYMKLGKREQAGALFAAMAKDNDIPPTIRGRALRLAAVNGVDAVAAPAASKE